MNRSACGLLLALLFFLPGHAQRVSHGPRELGIISLEALTIKEGKVIIRVGSNGCTGKASIRANIQKEKGLTERAPHYRVTFERVQVDECKALLSEGTLLEYDIARDLGLEGLYTLAVTNGVFPRSQDAVVEEMMLKKALRSATIRALEMEIPKCESRLKAAEGGLGPAGNAEKFRTQAAHLKSELEHFQKMDPFDYPLPSVREIPTDGFPEPPAPGPLTPPQKKTVAVIVKEPLKEGSILELEGMTRSGPFYHLAGIANGDSSRLLPGHRYEMTIYLVYSRAYFGLIPDGYVYVAEIK